MLFGYLARQVACCIHADFVVDTGPVHTGHVDVGLAGNFLAGTDFVGTGFAEIHFVGMACVRTDCLAAVAAFDQHSLKRSND